MPMLIVDQCVYTDLNHREIVPGIPHLTTNGDAVWYSLHNLLTTVVGERHNEVTYGVRLPDFLFETIDDITSHNLRFAIINAVRRWEPRVEPNLSQTTVDPRPEDNSYYIHLVFDIVGLDESSIIISGLYKKQFAKDLEAA